jgi:hypothetical protein
MNIILIIDLILINVNKYFKYSINRNRIRSMTLVIFL